MKRKIISSIVSALGLMFVAIPVSAADASITNTGPSSNNQITSNSSTSLVCAQTNSATVLNSNAQASSSGAASASGNTTAGSATSGSSSNANNVATAISQQNSCLPAAQQAAVPTPEGGKGGDMPAETVSAQVATLPNTGPLSPVEATARISAVLSGLAIAAYLGRDWMLRKLQ